MRLAQSLRVDDSADSVGGDATAPVTCGNFSDEKASGEAFDRAIARDVGLWKVYREVVGVLVQARPVQQQTTMRIDRVLVPKQKLIQLGWSHGAIGIELKRSGQKLGPIVAQAMDYSRSVWSLPGGIRLWLDWIFIWPAHETYCFPASIMAQHRIGAAWEGRHGHLRLWCDQHILSYRQADGQIVIGKGKNGKRAGSR